MPRVEPINNQSGQLAGYIFECPGCGQWHMITTKEPNGRGAKWSFNGDVERPTFNPSLLVRSEFNNGKPSAVCHSFIRDGRIQFLSDCTHALAGQTVELREVEDDDAAKVAGE